jgi:hypothetical protein
MFSWGERQLVFKPKAITEAAYGFGAFIFLEKPEADGDLRAAEELASDSTQVPSAFGVCVVH